MRVFLTLLVALLLALAVHATQRSDPSAPFIPHPVATDIFGGRQLHAADLNKDGKQDLIALGAQMTQLVWFENPYWQRRAIMHGTVGMRGFAASDLDGDGIPEVALAHGFTANAQNGRIAILKPFGDPRGIWIMQHIDRIAPSRRLLWADVEGSGQKALVDAPLLNDSTGLFEGSGLSIPLIFYRDGKLPQERMTLEDRGRVHELLISESGSIVTGSMNRQQFFSTSSGSNLLVYRQDPEGRWQSTIIDSSLPNGRALLAVDTDGDGNHEIVASASGNPKRVLLYRATDAGAQQWQRMLLDDTMAAAHCVAAELSADQRVDISCIDDTAPFSVHWYENRRN